MPQQLKARDFLLDPRFHGLNRDVRKSLLMDVWPEFASSSAVDQEATLDQSMEEWQKIISPEPAPEKEKSRWDTIKSWFSSDLEPPPSLDVDQGNQVQSALSAPAPKAKATEAPKIESGLIDFLRETVDTERLGSVELPGGATVPYGIAEKLPFIGGLATASKYADILRASSRIQKGTAKEADWAIMEQFKKEIDKDANTQNTWLRNVAEVAANIPGFAIEIGATGGAYTAARKVVQEGLEKVAKRAATKFAAKVAGVATGAAAQTALMPHRVAATALGTLAQQGPAEAIMAAEQAKPKNETEWREAFKKEIEDTDDDFVKAFLQAAPETFAEVFSERAGGGLAPLGKLKPFQRVSAFKSAIINKWLGTPGKSASDLYEKIAKATGWHGVLGEMFEERVADVQHYVQQGLGLESEVGKQSPAMVKMVTGEGGREEAFKEFMDQLSVEAASFALPGATSEVLSRIKSITKKEQEQKAASKASPEVEKEIEELGAPIVMPKLLGAGDMLQLGEEGTEGVLLRGGIPSEGTPGSIPRKDIIGGETAIPAAETEAEIEKELPFTDRDLQLMNERIQLYKDGIIKLPKIEATKESVSPNTIDELVKGALQREDFRLLRELRQKLGVAPLPEPGVRPTILEPDVTKEGLDRMRLFQEGKLAAPPTGATAEETEEVKRGIDRSRMAMEGKLEAIPGETNLLPPPPEYAHEETGTGLVNAAPRRKARVVSAQPSFPGFKSESGITRLEPPTEGVPEVQGEKIPEDPKEILNQLRSSFRSKENQIAMLTVKKEQDKANIESKYRQTNEANKQEFERKYKEINAPRVTREIEYNTALYDSLEKAGVKFEQDLLEIIKKANPRTQEKIKREISIAREDAPVYPSKLGRPGEGVLDQIRAKYDAYYLGTAAWRAISRVMGGRSAPRQIDTVEAIEGLRKAFSLEATRIRQEVRGLEIADYDSIDEDLRQLTRDYRFKKREIESQYDTELEELESSYNNSIAEIKDKFTEERSRLKEALKIAPVYFSRLERGVEQSQQKVFSAEQAEALVKKSTSMDELAYTGILDFINEKRHNNEKVTKQGLLDRIKEGLLKTSEVVWEDSRGGYGQYTEPGGEEYRELIVHEDKQQPSPVQSIEDSLLKRGIYKISQTEYLVLDKSGSFLQNYRRAEKLGWRKFHNWVNRFNDQLGRLSDYGTRTQTNATALLGGTGRQETFDFEPLPEAPVPATQGEEDRSGPVLKFSYGRLINQFLNVKEAADKVVLSEDSIVPADWRDGHPHYSNVPNPIVRLRFKTRYDVNGRKVMFIEEIQAPHGDPKFTVNGVEYSDAMEAKAKALVLNEKIKQAKGDEFNPKTDTVKVERGWTGEFSKMPKWAQTRWMDIGLKRALRWAAENDFDEMSWTTGAMQADRYNLARQVDEITYDPSSGRVKATQEGAVKFDQAISEKDLSAYLSPELARELMKQANEWRDKNGNAPLPTLKGDELNMRLTGLVDIYENVLPKAVADITKKYGVKVEPIEMRFGKDDDRFRIDSKLDGWAIYIRDQREYYRDESGNITIFKDWDDAKDVVDHQLAQEPAIELQAVPIPDEMRLSFMRQGLAYMSETGIMRGPTKEQIKRANATARSRGAVGGKALTPRWVLENAPKDASILDFGSGDNPIHTYALRNAGFGNVTAYDFGDNLVEGVHDPLALSRKYDVVMASNVINVQSDEAMARSTMEELKQATAPGGEVIMNFPKEPRHLPEDLRSTRNMYNLIREYFPNVRRVSGTKDSPVWAAKLVGTSESEYEPPLPKRSKRFGVGKEIGGDIYIHKSSGHVLPEPVRKKIALSNPGIEWTIIKYNPGSGSISLIESPDFDVSDEPIVGRSYQVNTGKTSNPPKDPFIYHHKWLMVADDYPGFDVGLSKARSRAWQSIDGLDKSRIGKSSYWQKNVVPKIPTVTSLVSPPTEEGLSSPSEIEPKITFDQLTGRGTINPARDYGVPEIEILPTTDADAFVAARGSSKRAPYLGNQTAAELEAEGAQLFMSKDGTVGYGISADGEMMNLFNNGIPGAGSAAAMESIRHGAYWCSCFDGQLPVIYTRLGFEVVARTPFVDEYAPAGWNYERDGRPDLVFAAWKGTNYARPEEVFDKSRAYKPGAGERVAGYDEAKAIARAAASPGWDVAAGAQRTGGVVAQPGGENVPSQLGAVGGGTEGFRGVVTPAERLEINLDRAAEAEDVRASLDVGRTALSQGSVTGAGIGAPEVRPGGGAGLEGPVPGSLEGPPEVSGTGTERGRGGPEQKPESLGSTATLISTNLLPGQTVPGKKVGESINRSPVFEVAGRQVHVFDSSGEVDRSFMEYVAESPVIRVLSDVLDSSFIRIKNALVESDTENSTEYDNTIFDGITLDVTTFGSFWPGDRLYGTGARNRVYLNPLSSMAVALRHLRSGAIKPEELSGSIAFNMVDTVVHEAIHTVERNEDINGHRKKMEDFYRNNGDLVVHLAKNIKKILESDDFSSLKNLQIIHDDYVETIKNFYEPETFVERGLALEKKVGEPFVPTDSHYDKIKDLIIKEGVSSEKKALENFKEEFPNVRAADFKAIWKEGMLRAANQIEGLTDVELERVSKDASSIKRISDAIESLPPETDLVALAQMGEVKRGWYARAVQACRALADMVDPSDRVVLVRIIAATSPRQAVKSNMLMALSTYNEWVRRGRPTDREDLEKWLPNFAKMSSRWKNTIRAIKGEPFSDYSYKVSAFADNLLDDVLQNTQAVTNDTHQAKLAPPEFKLGNYTAYYALSARTRSVAKKLGWQPREVQETLWSVMKTVWEIAESEGETRPPSELLQNITEQDIIERSTEFSVLLTEDKDVHDALIKLGVNPQTLKRKIRRYGGGYTPTPTGRPKEDRPGISQGLRERLDRALEVSKEKKRENVERRRYAKEVAQRLSGQGIPEDQIEELVLFAVQKKFGKAKHGEMDIPLPEELETFIPLETPPSEEEEEQAIERAAIQSENESYSATTGLAGARLAPPPGSGAPSLTPDLDEVKTAFEKRPDPPKPTLNERIRGLSHEVERRWITEFAPVAHMEEKVRKAAGLPSKPYTENLATWMEGVYGASAMAERDMMELESVVAPIKKNIKEFDYFLFLRRTQDRLQEDPTVRRVAGWDLPKVQRALAQLRSEVGNNVVDQYYLIADHQINNGVFTVGPYQKVMDDALKLMVSSGRMSQDVYLAIKAKNDFYAPFKVLQYLDPASDPESVGGGAGRKIATRADLTYAIKGIDDPDFRIDSILEESAKQIYRARILAEKNKAMLEMANLAQFDPNGETIKFTEGPVFLPPGAPGEKGRWILPNGEGIPKNKEVLPFKKDGKNVALIVDKDVATAVQGMNQFQSEITSKVLRATMAPARWGATTFNLAFQPVNYLFADMPRLATMSRYGIQNLGDAFKYMFDFMSGTVSAMRGSFGNADYLYKKALEMGVLNSTIQKVLTPEIFAEKYSLEPPKGGILRGAKRLTIDNFAKFANGLEESTKVTGVKRALKLEGYDQLTGRAKEVAANRIRTELRRYSGSPDFARAGVDARLANLWFMFINARLQGTHSDVGRLLGKTGTKAAAGAWARLSMMMMPMLGVALLNRGDDDLERDYAQVPSWEKDNYFMIPLPNRFINEDGVSVREYARIPKREIFQIMGNVIDGFVGWFADKDKPSLRKVADSFFGNISPVNIQGENLGEKAESVIGGTNPIIKAPAEQIFNRDMFRHRDIVPRSLEDLPPELQYKPTTPDVYKKIGEITGFSPVRIQQATSGISAGLITQFTMGKPEGDRGWYTEMPVIKRFVRSPNVSSEAEDARLSDAITANATDSAVKKRLAEVLYSTVKGKSIKEQMMLVSKTRRESKDPLLADTLKSIIKEANRGLTFQDRQMMRLGVKSGDRAAYIAGALDRLPNDQARSEWIKDLRKKKILTREVMGQIKRKKQPVRRWSEAGGMEAPPE